MRGTAESSSDTFLVRRPDHGTESASRPSAVLDSLNGVGGTSDNLITRVAESRFLLV